MNKVCNFYEYFFIRDTHACVCVASRKYHCAALSRERRLTDAGEMPDVATAPRWETREGGTMIGAECEAVRKRGGKLNTAARRV